jgi:hypothetical protein
MFDLLHIKPVPTGHKPPGVRPPVLPRFAVVEVARDHHHASVGRSSRLDCPASRNLVAELQTS